MPMSPSPQLSPVIGGTHRIDRHHTNSPPLPLSKRDKRRTMLADRLEEITKAFSSNRDMHYREQLQAIQVDMNLIMEADPHGAEPLPDQPEEIDALVLKNCKFIRKTDDPVIPPRAGKMYADFAKEVNDAMEEKDSASAAHKRDYAVKLAELTSDYQYRKKLANDEYRALSSTLRDRLINSVTSKKNRLSKDKEIVEIGDSNALLLHPSQYGLANPTSPGMHGKRATRHRRDADDITFSDSHKRKRKAGDSDESPAPSRQRLENGTSTPLWFQEKRDMAATQIDSPLYSIDKLFTEKELSMYYNTAALAAHQHILRHPPYSNHFDSPPNGHSNQSLEDLHATLDPEDADSPEAGGVSMERQYSHATRSTRNPNFNTGFGIDAISDLNFPGNFAALVKQVPKMPPLLASTSVMQKGYVKGDAANQPAGLAPDDAAADLEMMRQARMYNEQKGRGKNLEQANGGKSLLEAVAHPMTYDHWIRSDKSQYTDSNSRDEVVGGLGGESMSRGPSDVGMGGTPMSRTATGDRVMSSRGRAIKSTPNHG